MRHLLRKHSCSYRSIVPPLGGSIAPLLGFWLTAALCAWAGGPVDHFEWDTIPSPQQVDVLFHVGISARDTGNQLVTNFSGPVSITGKAGEAVQSFPVLGDLTYQDFSYASYGPASAGYAFTPDADITVTHVRAFSGGQISIWTDDGVLLARQDASDFGGTWVEIPLLVPLALSVGNTYRVTLWSGACRYYWRTGAVFESKNVRIVAIEHN